MSKLSRFFLGLILVGLAFIASLHLYRAYERYTQPAEEISGPVLTFNQIPIDFTPQIPPETAFTPLPDPAHQEVFWGEVPLNSEAEREQARQTIRSILDDYRQDEKLQAFYADLLQATGRPIDLADLSGENLNDLLKQYPQLQEVLPRHMRDPELAKTLQEIFSNPQFIRSVAVLQLGQSNK